MNRLARMVTVASTLSLGLLLLVLFVRPSGLTGRRGYE